MWNRRRAVILALGLVVVVSACGSSTPGVAASSTASGPPGSAAAATQTPSPGPSATSSAGSSPGSTHAAVDLTFSGWRNVAAKGTLGNCSLAPLPDGTTGFLFNASGTDYPGLGTGVMIQEVAGHAATLNWFIGSGIGYTNRGGPVIAVSVDHHTVTLDLALIPVHSQATQAPGPEHPKGTVTCG